jgi:hypothetical protein
MLPEASSRFQANRQVAVITVIIVQFAMLLKAVAATKRANKTCQHGGPDRPRGVDHGDRLAKAR